MNLILSKVYTEKPLKIAVLIAMSFSLKKFLLENDIFSLLLLLLLLMLSLMQYCTIAIKCIPLKRRFEKHFFSAKKFFELIKSEERDCCRSHLNMQQMNDFPSSKEESQKKALNLESILPNFFSLLTKNFSVFCW